MFLESMTFLAEDFVIALYSITPKDFAYPSYILLWMVILYLPLHGIDCADPVAGMVYVLYCIGSGATLFFALPNEFNSLEDLGIHFGTLLAMGIAGAYRWGHKNSQTLTRAEHEEEVRKHKGISNDSSGS